MSTSMLVRETNRHAHKGKVERFVDVAGTRVRYLEAGMDHDDPPLIMLHGYRAGADYWFPHPMPELAEEHHTIALDLPGYGYSGRLRVHNLNSYAVFMHDFLDVLGYPLVNLLGHSMGAQIAIAMAARQPERVNKLVLVDSTGLPRFEPQWQVPMKMLGDSSMRHIKLFPLVMRLGAMAAAGQEGLHMLQKEHVTGILKSLTMPTLIVWGSRDRVIPMEHGALMARNIPQARLAVIRNAGHMPFYQKPQEFNRLVLTFLRQEA